MKEYQNTGASTTLDSAADEGEVDPLGISADDPFDPREFARLPQWFIEGVWVCWRHENQCGRWTAAPYDPRTGEPVSAEGNGYDATYNDAWESMAPHACDGIGRVYRETDRLPDDRQRKAICEAIGHEAQSKLRAFVVSMGRFIPRAVSDKKLGDIPRPVPIEQLVSAYGGMRAPVVHDLLRVGETANIISASKVGKSWLVLDLAFSVASGRCWLNTFDTSRGNVLIIDNELHPETSRARVNTVLSARGIAWPEVESKIHFQHVRGRLQDLKRLGRYFEKIPHGYFKLVVIDAFYRILPQGTDENDNGAVADLYNTIDQYAERLGCAFVLIHHTSKGNQSAKTVTDVGAGAGSQSRAADTHLVLRHHKEDGVVVLEAATRSFPSPTPLCLRFNYPTWNPVGADEGLDATELRSDRNPGRRAREAKEPAKQKVEWTPEAFVQHFAGREPKPLATVVAKAKTAGITDWQAKDLVALAEDEGRLHRWKMPNRRTVYVATREQELFDGADGDEINKRAHTPHTPRVRRKSPRGRGRVRVQE
jgi:hypothetical protein